MPIVSAETELGPRHRLTPEIEPTTGEVFDSAFSIHNTAGSMLDRGLKPDFDLEPDFEPLSEENLKGFENFADSFIGAQSKAESEWIKGNILRELEHRQTLEAGGVTGFAASLAAGVTDPLFIPLMLIPGGWMMKGGAFLRGAKFAGMGAAGEGATELALHSTQETRTAIESALNIGGATVLSGILGSASSLLTRTEFDDLAKQVEVEINLPVDSAGAMATRATTLEEEALVSTGGVARVVGEVSPLTRLKQSPAKASRQIVEELAETPLFTQKNIEGKATPVATETAIKRHDARLGVSFEKLDEGYIAYRQRLGSKASTRFGQFVRDLSGRQGALSYREFREEVGKAMRRGDKHRIPEVEAAARTFRRNLFEPHKKAAIELGLLPEGVRAKGAYSYLTRVYNIDRIKAERPQFKAILTEWVQSQGVADTLEAQSIADEIIQNIMSTPAGMIPRDVVPTAGPLKERVLTISDDKIEAFLESDIEQIARYYNHTMAPEIELTRKFGDKELFGEMSIIRNEYDNLISAAKSERQVKRLQKHLEADLRDIEAIRDILIGTFRRPEDPSSFFVRAGRGIRQLNYVRLLGGMTLSAIPDLARPIMRHGLKAYARELKALTLHPKRFKMAMKEAKAAGAGWDLVLNTRAQAIADVTDIYASGTKIEKGLRVLSDTFGVPSLMAPWNAAMKQFSGVMSAHSILQATIGRAGKVSKKSTMKLAQSGIDESMAGRIAAQFKEFGERGDVWLSHSNRWSDREAAEVFNAAVLKDVDVMIVTPGAADRPLWMSSEQGKLIGQFRSFAFAASNRVMLAGLQQRDAATLNGLILSTALGSIVYGLKNYVAGRDISTDADKVLVESLDRSGVYGWLFDANNIIEKATRGRVGVSALTGEGMMSRYASRGVLGALLGPSADLVDDASTAIGAISAGDMSASDVRRIRKLLPYQNLFYTRNLLNQAEQGVANAIGTDQ